VQRQEADNGSRKIKERKAVKRRILLFEDSETNRRLFHDLLEVYGYCVRSLPNGLNFLRALTEFKPNLILLDLKMPYLDGFTLLQQLQSSPFSKIPVVVVSAYGTEREKQRALQLGARSYLIKPAAIEDIIRAVETELDCVDRLAPQTSIA
jgi:two-component system, cell cycle response regulator DivK